MQEPFRSRVIFRVSNTEKEAVAASDWQYDVNHLNVKTYHSLVVVIMNWRHWHRHWHASPVVVVLKSHEHGGFFSEVGSIRSKSVIDQCIF